MLRLRPAYLPPLAGPAGGACAGCGAVPEAPTTAGRPAVGPDGLFDLHGADASRDGAFRQLLLLEQHLVAEQCPECMNKHLSTAIAYFEEAATLRGGDDEDRRVAGRLLRLRGGLASGGEVVRAVRKATGRRLGFGADHRAEAVTGSSRRPLGPSGAVLVAGAGAIALLCAACL